MAAPMFLPAGLAMMSSPDLMATTFLRVGRAPISSTAAQVVMWLPTQARRAAVTVNLATGTGSSGDAAGDTLAAIESLAGSAFGDTLIGDGDANANALTGNAGDDLLVGGSEGDQLRGGAGRDTAVYSAAAAALVVSLAAGTGSGSDAQGDTLIGVENIVGSAFADTLTGDANANILTGGGAADRLDGGAGSDTSHRDVVAERQTLDARAHELLARGALPSSALACLHAIAGDTVAASCEKALFQTLGATAAAVSYVSAQLTLLADLAIESAAAARRVPLETITVAQPDVVQRYQRRLVLVRPDGHVAWRANEPARDAVAGDP
jgi:aromatic ring hydroxylase-like protein/hemolysin type calcium-binding protein